MKKVNPYKLAVALTLLLAFPLIYQNCAPVHFNASPVTTSSTGTNGTNGNTTGTTNGTNSTSGGLPTTPDPTGTNGSTGGTTSVTATVGNAGFLVLDPASAKAMSLTGGAQVQVTGGNVIVDSNNIDALDLAGGNTNLSAMNVYVTGNFQSTGTITPAPMTGATPVADPLNGLAQPSTTGMTTYTGMNISNATTLQPGVYTGPVSVTGTTTVSLAPGIYVFNGGLSVSGGSALNGDGVLIYIAGGSVSISGGGATHLTPATSGYYAGITFFQARNDYSTSSLSGGSNWFMKGVAYFPSNALQLSGGSNLPLPLVFISYDLTINGGSFILSQ